MSRITTRNTARPQEREKPPRYSTCSRGINVERFAYGSSQRLVSRTTPLPTVAGGETQYWLILLLPRHSSVVCRFLPSPSASPVFLCRCVTCPSFRSGCRNLSRGKRAALIDFYIYTSEQQRGCGSDMLVWDFDEVRIWSRSDCKKESFGPQIRRGRGGRGVAAGKMISSPLHQF